MGHAYSANRVGKLGDGLCGMFYYMRVPMIVWK